MKNKDRILPYLTPYELQKGNAAFFQEFYSDPCYGLPIGIKVFEEYEHLFPFPKNKIRIMDCGVGGGHFLQYCSDHRYENLYGFDIGDYRGGGVKSKTLGEFVTLDASYQKLPWPDNFFDVATAWCLCAHLENPHNFIREVNRVLKPGGIFFNELPYIGSLLVRKNFLKRGELDRYTADNDHISIFTPAIFKKIVLKYFDPFAAEYYIDPKIFQTRLGWIKRVGAETNWRYQKKFQKWFATEVIHVLKKK